MNPIEWTQTRLGESLSWDGLIALVKIAQEQLGVAADGKPGAQTMLALRRHLGDQYGSKRLPVPRTRKQAADLYGNPSWVKLPRGRAVDLDDRWESKNIKWFKLHTGKRVRLHRLVGSEFVRVFREACEESGYTPRSVQTYVPRIIGGSNPPRLSYHAFGVAVDFDPSNNPWHGKQKSGEWSLLRQHPEFVRVFERNGWVWGGRWKDGLGDDMHFQRAGKAAGAGEPIKGE